ncbi:MAG: hypothetical protein WD030_07255 [Pirellulales bacterium]
MYHAYWGLRHSPFAGGPARRGFFESSTHEEAIARLLYLVENRKRLGLLLGGSGLGKSLTLELFAAQLRSDDLPVARLNLAAVGREELPLLLAEQFHVAVSENTSAAIAWRRLLGLLAENVYQHQTTTILFDDVDQADPDAMKVVMRLLHTDAAIAGRLTVVLALRTANLRLLPECLLDAAELRIDLEPWSACDTAGYLRAVLLEAGRGDAAFDDQAVARLHELAGGVPRRVAHLADLALLAGADRQLKQVDSRTVEEVAEELQPVQS